VKYVYDNTTQPLLPVNHRDGPSQTSIHQCIATGAANLSLYPS
jgi:hypothetical protein